MQAHLRTRILQLTQADDIRRVALIQPLWNDYGTLSRVFLDGGAYTSVIVKHIQIPDRSDHPRGFMGSLSKERKIKSYAVETHWYQHQNQQVTEASPTPRCLDAFDHGHEVFILLEDLATRGYSRCLQWASWGGMTVVLRWLAGFHAQFLMSSAEGLWSIGTYWHLATRPEELENIRGTRLHRFASLLDARLRCSPFQTVVHGDAKLANFCFSEDHANAAAVDFQYVGRGCAMKDVAYFVGSCLSGTECQRQESAILAFYFEALHACLPPQFDGAAVEVEWRLLYPIAWADFQRFMMGWCPGHRKLTPYSDATTEKAIDQMIETLLGSARSACLTAGRFIQEQRDEPYAEASKGFKGGASDIVTAIDLQAQALIMAILGPTIERYDLGLLAEEGEHDDSRLKKHAFWAIDPLDGTRYFVDGNPGYATSIALVSQSGQPILGVVYDPVDEQLYEAVIGGGVTLNGVALEPIQGHGDPGAPMKWFADRSLREDPDFEQIQTHLDVRFAGGAVMNTLQLLHEPNSVYCKRAKSDLGGCAIWDLAAVTLILSELGGRARFIDGDPMHLNRSESLYFNDVGLMLSSADVDQDELMERLTALGVQGLSAS